MEDQQIESTSGTLSHNDNDPIPRISSMALKRRRNIWLEQDDVRSSRNHYAPKPAEEMNPSSPLDASMNETNVVQPKEIGTAAPTPPRTKKKRKFVHHYSSTTMDRAGDGTYVCSLCHTSGFVTPAVLESHTQTCCGLPKVAPESSSSHNNPFGFTPDNNHQIQEETAKLSDFNQLTLEALDMYEVQASDLPLSRRQRVHVQVGSIGIRCRYCAAQKAETVGCLLFPGNLELLCIIVYRIRDKHFLGTECPYIPEAVRSRMRTMKARSKIEKKGDIGLPTYMRTIVGHYNLVDTPNGNGIRRKEQSLIKEEDG